MQRFRERNLFGRLAQLSTPTQKDLKYISELSRAFSSAGSEHLPYKQRVGGSNPSTPTQKDLKYYPNYLGRLAQLVQSICLTSRGSAVRIRQRPLQRDSRKGFLFLYPQENIPIPYETMQIATKASGREKQKHPPLFKRTCPIFQRKYYSFLNKFADYFLKGSAFPSKQKRICP